MDQLAKPIGLLMRPTFSVDLQDSLELAARKLRENGGGTLPVVENGQLAGAITESGLAAALAEGRGLDEAVSTITRGIPTAHPATTGAQALRMFEDQQANAIIVIDDAGRVLGLLAPSDLFPKRLIPPRPPLVGGMATPFGVYLTTGSLRAGVGHLALVATGMTLFSLLLVASLITNYVTIGLEARGVAGPLRDAIEGVLPFALFLLGMRLIPLSGIHAAEHKVVHAIERGEDLLPSTVSRMPRVHPRCGTNLAIGASLFIGLGTMELPIGPVLKLMFAGIATLLLWRPLGNAMQFYVTTKKPSEKHLAMGIRSGRELLEKYATQGGKHASIFQRIVNSGMIHVIVGSNIAFWLYYLISVIFHLPDPISAV